MGWWSATVLGGDGPLDWLGDLCDTMGIDMVDCDKVECEGFYGYPYTRELLEAHLDEMAARIRTDTDDPQIGWQVLGALVLHTGAEISDEVRAAVIRAATEDAWANEGSQERVAFMTDLSDKMLAHKPGQCVELAQEGLMEKIVEKLEARA